MFFLARDGSFGVGRMPTPKLCRAAELKSECGSPLTLNWSQEPRINNL